MFNQICIHIFVLRYSIFVFIFLLQYRKERRVDCQVRTSLSLDLGGQSVWGGGGMVVLTSSISMCVLGEAVDNGVDCFLEDGLGPRVGHRTRHWPTARGNGGCGLRLRPRHVRRHADPRPTSIQGHTRHTTTISIQSMGQTHT